MQQRRTIENRRIKFPTQCQICLCVQTCDLLWDQYKVKCDHKRVRAKQNQKVKREGHSIIGREYIATYNLQSITFECAHSFTCTSGPGIPRPEWKVIGVFYKQVADKEIIDPNAGWPAEEETDEDTPITDEF